MSETKNRLRTISTWSMIAAVGTFAYWRFVYRNGPFLELDPRQCYRVVEAGGAYQIAGAVLWLGALELAGISILLGMLTWKFWSSVKGVLALAIAFINIANVPSADSIQFAPEPFAIATLRTINTAEVTYRSTLSGGLYGSITELVRHDLLDSRFEEHYRKDYKIALTLEKDGYLVVATPTSPNASAQGCWEYYSTEDAVIRFSNDPSKAPARRAGMPIDQ